MGIFKRLKNLYSDGDSADLNEAKLLNFLGIDPKNREAIQEVTYYTCLKVLAETMGKLPLKFYQTEDGGQTRAENDAMADLLTNRPNKFMTPATFWSTMEANCEHYGNAYAWIQTKFKKNGKFGGDVIPVGIWPMQSDCVTVYWDDAGIFADKGGLYYGYTDPKSGQQYMFDADEVVHIKTWLTWDGVMGKSVRDILRETVGAAGQAQKYLETLYDSGLTQPCVLQYTGDLDEKLRKQLQMQYNSLLAGTKDTNKGRARVVPLPVGMTLSPLGIKLTDSQFYELKKYTALQIAGAFGVKPNQINDYEKSSYANSETQQLAFLVDTMLFRITQYEQEINYKCLSKKQRNEGYFYKFNEKTLLRTDAKTQASIIDAHIQNGVYTPNEGRHLLDLPSAEGGDQLIVNGNFVPITAVGAAYGISEKGGGEE